MHGLNPSTNNKVGHLFQGDNHYCYTFGQAISHPCACLVVDVHGRLKHCQFAITWADKTADQTALNVMYVSCNLGRFYISEVATQWRHCHNNIRNEQYFTRPESVSLTYINDKESNCMLRPLFSYHSCYWDIENHSTKCSSYREEGRQGYCHITYLCRLDMSKRMPARSGLELGLDIGRKILVTLAARPPIPKPRVFSRRVSLPCVEDAASASTYSKRTKTPGILRAHL
jgi:hypothetical protein